MAHLFIPEIGTQLALARDWTFTLHHEGRNSEVWKALGEGATAPAINAWQEKLVDLDKELREFERTKFHEVPNPNANRWLYAPPSLKEPKPEHAAAYQDLKDRRWSHYHESATAPVTLPVGTVLSVDRIYIRKGMSDFSSVSFFILETTHPNLTRDKKARGFKKGRKRFWAKLADVNTIQFNIAEEVPA